MSDTPTSVATAAGDFSTPPAGSFAAASSSFSVDDETPGGPPRGSSAPAPPPPMANRPRFFTRTLSVPRVFPNTTVASRVVANPSSRDPPPNRPRPPRSLEASSSCASISASVGARTPSATSSSSRTRTGGFTARPLTVTSAQGWRSDANIASPSRRTR